MLVRALALASFLALGLLLGGAYFSIGPAARAHTCDMVRWDWHTHNNPHPGLAGQTRHRFMGFILEDCYQKQYAIGATAYLQYFRWQDWKWRVMHLGFAAGEHQAQPGVPDATHVVVTSALSNLGHPQGHYFGLNCRRFKIVYWHIDMQGNQHQSRTRYTDGECW